MPRQKIELSDDSQAFRVVAEGPYTPQDRFIAYIPRPTSPLTYEGWRDRHACMAAGPELADLLESVNRKLDLFLIDPDSHAPDILTALLELFDENAELLRRVSQT